MSYRLATRDDWPRIDPLLRAFLVEHRLGGSAAVVSARNVENYRRLAEDYLHGRIPGVVVLAHEDNRLVGFALAGEPQAPGWLELDGGKTAVVWIAYVDPAYRKKGVALGMLVWGRPHLLELGFETATMGVREDNEVALALCRAFGARASERLLRFPLNEEPGHG